MDENFEIVPQVNDVMIGRSHGTRNHYGTRRFNGRILIFTACALLSFSSLILILWFFFSNISPIDRHDSFACPPISRTISTTPKNHRFRCSALRSRKWAVHQAQKEWLASHRGRDCYQEDQEYNALYKQAKEYGI